MCCWGVNFSIIFTEAELLLPASIEHETSCKHERATNGMQKRTFTL